MAHLTQAALSKSTLPGCPAFVFHGISNFRIPFTCLPKGPTMQWSDRIGRRIKLRDLHVLQAVVHAGSMTKAANQLAISVPVVSKAIADLEHTVGVQLLDREPQGVEPTAYGRAFLHRSAIAFEELRQGIKDIEFLADPTVGEVRIGSIVTLAASFISAIIDRLSRRYPRIAFRVVVEGTEMLRDLHERSGDLLI